MTLKREMDAAARISELEAELDECRKVLASALDREEDLASRCREYRKKLAQCTEATDALRWHSEELEAQLAAAEARERQIVHIYDRLEKLGTEAGWASSHSPERDAQLRGTQWRLRALLQNMRRDYCSGTTIALDAALKERGLAIIELLTKRVSGDDSMAQLPGALSQEEVEAIFEFGKAKDAALEQALAEGYKQGQDDYHAQRVKPDSDAWADGFAAGEAAERERLTPLLEKARQLADIANSWGLPEIELEPDGKWIRTAQLKRAFAEAIRDQEEANGKAG